MTNDEYVKLEAEFDAWFKPGPYPWALRSQLLAAWVAKHEIAKTATRQIIADYQNALGTITYMASMELRTGLRRRMEHDRAITQMTQTKLESWLEASANTILGFVISYFVWVLVVVPVFAIPNTHAQSFAITCIFTVASLLRAYAVRRFFNARLHQACHAFAKAIMRNFRRD